MARLRGLNAGLPEIRHRFQGLLTAFGKSPWPRLSGNPALSMHPTQWHHCKNRGRTTMKSFIILATAALLTVNAVAAMPASAANASDKSAQTVVMMAEQELPFDRYWSKN